MPAAQKARLLAAVDDYLRAVGGDGGRGPRGAQLDGPDAELFKAAQGIRDMIGQGESEQGTSPGRRAAGATGGQQGDQFHRLADRARDMVESASTAGAGDGAGVG